LWLSLNLLVLLYHFYKSFICHAAFLMLLLFSFLVRVTCFYVLFFYLLLLICS
jgi:hypothetical protein